MSVIFSEKPPVRPIRRKPQGSIAEYLVAHGVCKNTRAATALLVISAVVILCGGILLLATGKHKATVVPLQPASDETLIPGP